MMDTLNNGKTITESFTHDTAGAIAVFEYYAGAAFHLHGRLRGHLIYDPESGIG